MSVIARLGLASANQRVRRVSARQLGPDLTKMGVATNFRTAITQ